MKNKLSHIDYVKYTGIMIMATFLTFFFHEMAHWASYELLGYNAGFTLNGASPKDSSIELPKWHRIITSASGPVFTILQAIAFYFILKKRKQILLYPFLFLPFTMRLGATWANQFQPNDEGRISLDLGLNLYAVSAVVVVFLGSLLVIISRKNKYSFLFNLLTFVLSAVLILALAYFDSKYKIRFI